MLSAKLPYYAVFKVFKAFLDFFFLKIFHIFGHRGGGGQTQCGNFSHFFLTDSLTLIIQEMESGAQFPAGWCCVERCETETSFHSLKIAEEIMPH